MAPVEDRKARMKTRSIQKEIDMIARYGHWSKLPDNILETVFTYLSRADQVSAALVCHHWSRAIHSPNLWRKMVVHLSTTTPHRLRKLLNIAKRYGHYLRYLEIDYHRTNFRTRPFLESQLIVLFNGIRCRNPQLKHFCFRKFFFREFYSLRKSLFIIRARLFNSVCRFLKTQHTLSTVDMTRMRVSVQQGSRLLQTIANRNSTNLRTLLLEDFFHSQQAVFSNGTFLSILGNLKHLSKVALNYSYVSEEVIECLATNCAGRLKSLTLKCDSDQVHYHTLDNATWKRLRRACPNVLVDFKIGEIHDMQTLTRLVPTQVPLRALKYWTADFWDGGNPLDPSNFTSYVVANFQETLEDLNLSYDDEVPWLDTIIESYLPGLRNLKRLALVADLPLDFFEHIFILKMQNQINVREIHLTSCNLEGDVFEHEVQRLERQLGDPNVHFRVL